ncbi:MAG: class I SAM-dependent RNA methyltransferase [Rhodocyclaceae bacterium]|nr:class I SAM-dependent RNA methyltransferase [Rhodocyclaceae bacterium]MBP6108950.1 class I SAM-dependent RNA methyltransferase [Rhodocyclaceae bacterium]
MKHQFFASCPRGLEELLGEDLAAAGGRQVKTLPGGAACTGDWATAYRINLESRIATRLLWRLAYGDYRTEADIYRLAYNINWSKLFSVERNIRVYVTAIRSPLKSLEFITLKVKDAVCDRFRADTDRRPSVNTRNPEIRIHLFLTDTQATIYLDTSGEPLYQRGHKAAKIEAPLKENLAAGILRLAGWTPEQTLLDPMCGSGTFLLEAVQMSLDDAPGLSREAGEFGFERLLNFDPTLWRELQRAAAERRRETKSLPIFGSDISADAVARTQQNLAHAGLEKLVKVERADLLTRTAPASSGSLITNPPYGERLGNEDELAAFYPLLGDALKKNFAGWRTWFLSADVRFPKLLGLRVGRKTPLFNGPLECRLYGIDIVAGSARPKN